MSKAGANERAAATGYLQIGICWKPQRRPGLVSPVYLKMRWSSKLPALIKAAYLHIYSFIFTMLHIYRK